MRSTLKLLSLTAFLLGIVIAPGHAAVILEDNFNTGDMIGTPDVGRPWSLGAGGTVPLVDGKAIIDPTENNPTIVVDPDTGEERDAGVSISIVQRFLPAVNFLHIPPASSGSMLEINTSLVDRGAESTPTGDNATHEDIETGELRLFSGMTEIYLPAFGAPGSKQGTGSYWTGFYVMNPHPANHSENTGVPIPGPGETHLVRSRIRSLPTGHGFEAVIDVSADGGATYSRIGRQIEEYQFINGTGPDDPGFFTGFQFVGRGTQNDPDEGEFAIDFVRIEDLPFEPTKGDMDQDGDVDFDDIDEFVLGLNDPDTYRSTFWVEASQNGDTDMDGDQDFDDIAGFVGILSGGGGVAGVPEPSTFVLAIVAVLGAIVYSWPKRRT